MFFIRVVLYEAVGLSRSIRILGSFNLYITRVANTSELWRCINGLFTISNGPLLQ